MNVYKEIQKAIEQAWATADPVTKQRQIELVGDTHIPTPDELITLISSKVRSENQK